MLWRTAYAPRILRAVVLPRLEALTLDDEPGATPEAGPLLGAFGPLAGAELGVWRRLMAEAEVAAPTVLVRHAWTPRERRDVRLAVAPALHPWTLLAEDPADAWVAAVGPDRPERAFAAVMRGGVAELLMVGPPTEEAWDEFRESC